MRIRRKWLRLVLLFLMVGASFGSPMNPQELEEQLHIMNEVKVEFTIPDKDRNSDDV
jgi:hypothetical protein